jgi:hypothetical protein
MALVRTDVSEELSVSIIRVTRISKIEERILSKSDIWRPTLVVVYKILF